MNMVGAVLKRASGDTVLRGSDLKAQARRCRRLATGVSDESAADTLYRMADEYDAMAAEMPSGREVNLQGPIS